MASEGGPGAGALGARGVWPRAGSGAGGVHTAPVGAGGWEGLHSHSSPDRLVGHGGLCSRGGLVAFTLFSSGSTTNHAARALPLTDWHCGVIVFFFLSFLVMRAVLRR